MSFIEELKRRNVFKVGIAYLVGAWLALQFADMLLDNIGAPPWVLQSIMVVLGIGLFVTLFFAWAFEMTPEGVKREKDVDRSQSITPVTGKKLNNAILIMMALAIAYLLFDKFSGSGNMGSESKSLATQSQAGNPSNENLTLSPAEPVAGTDPKSIAVLPFDNRSRNVDDEFFVEGVHDDLLTNLARIGSLKVISRTSVLRYKDTEKPIPEIAKELGVATVMEGAVQRSGNQIRINVQLIDAISDKHLWAEIFDREMSTENLFAIQSEISEKIADALKTTLSPEEQERISDRPTENLAAYNAYLRGRQLQTRRNSTDLTQALKEFESAVELDPEFALAWVGVADTASMLVSYSNLSMTDSIRIQENAAGKALAINDQLGEAHVSMAGVHSFYERYDEAEAEYLKGIELSPSYATAYQWYADFITTWPKRWKESLELTQKAVNLDPLSSILQMELAEKLSNLGRYDAAAQRVESLLQFDPDFAIAYRMMAYIESELGHFDEQILWTNRSLEKDPGRLFSYLESAIAQVNIGNPTALGDLRKHVEAIDDQHVSLGWMDVVENVYDKNFAAALEAGKWVNNKLGNAPSFQGFFGFVNVMAGKYPEALAAYTAGEPRYEHRDQWPAAIQQNTSQACDVGWLKSITGETQDGLDLLNMTLAYLENELPLYTEHADRFQTELCYLAKGETEKALAHIEKRVAHGHINGWFFQVHHPLLEPLQGTPRFEAAMRTIQDRITLQREHLERLQAQAEP